MVCLCQNGLREHRQAGPGDKEMALPVFSRSRLNSFVHFSTFRIHGDAWARVGLVRWTQMLWMIDKPLLTTAH